MVPWWIVNALRSLLLLAAAAQHCAGLPDDDTLNLLQAGSAVKLLRPPVSVPNGKEELSLLLNNCMVSNIHSLYGHDQDYEPPSRRGQGAGMIKLFESDGRGADPSSIFLKVAKRLHDPISIVLTVVLVFFLCLLTWACVQWTSSDEHEQDARKPGVAEYWMRSTLLRRALALPEKGRIPHRSLQWIMAQVTILIITVVVAYSLVDGPVFHRYFWVPFMGIVGCALPSSGVPVAGGTIYFPALNFAGVPPQSCIAFVVATQAVSVGLLTPMTWLIKDPTVLNLQAFYWALPAAVVGLLFGLFVVPLHGQLLLWVFTCCMALLLVYTLHGLMHDLAGQDEELDMTRWPLRIQMLLAGLIGGVVTGWIGVGCEKLLFFVLTMHGASSVKSSVLGVSVAGFLSFLSTLYQVSHGAFPLQLWCLVTPGLLVGSIFGVHLHRTFGSRTILFVFAIFLACDVVKSVTSLLKH